VPIQITEIRPEWINLPRSGELCPYSGLKRRALDFLTRPQESNNFNPPVKSRVITQTGIGNWRRMINYRSLMEYIENQPVELKETPRKREALANHRTPKPGPGHKPRQRRVKEQEVAAK
jgi:hypothetical protein